MKFLVILTVSCLLAYSEAKSIDKNCSPGSLSNLEIGDLLEKSGVSEECREEARKVYTQKYHDYKVSMSYFSKPSTESIVARNFTSRTAIDINRFQKAKEFLNNFGDLIEDCEIQFYDIDEMESKDVLNHLNDKTSKTLKSLGLYGCHETTLNGLNKPFEQVMSLKLSAGESNLSQKFCQFFPNLQKFNLRGKISDWSFNGLVSLELSEQSHEVESNIADLIKRSTQLKFLKLEWQNHAILEIASEYIPKSVQIWIFNKENQNRLLSQQNVDLSTVKNLEVFTFEMDITLSPFNFNQLEHFTLDMRASSYGCIPMANRNDLSDEWKSFITSKVNPSLKEITLATRTINKANIEFILKTFPNLNAVNFDVMYSEFTFPHLNGWNVEIKEIQEPYLESTVYKLTKQ